MRSGWPPARGTTGPTATSRVGRSKTSSHRRSRLAAESPAVLGRLASSRLEEVEQDPVELLGLIPVRHVARARYHDESGAWDVSRQEFLRRHGHDRVALARHDEGRAADLAKPPP